MTCWPDQVKIYFYHWILQVQVKKSLLSRAACDAYLAQRCPAAGAGKQTDGKGPYRPMHIAPTALDAVCSRADVSYLPYRPFLPRSISVHVRSMQGRREGKIFMCCVTADELQILNSSIK